MAVGISRGGSLRLVELIDQHGEALEADLHATYGIDLLDVYRGRIHPAKVLRYISWLPDDGPFVASLLGGREHLGWGTNRALATWHADIAAAAAMAGSKKKPPKFPTPQRKRRPRIGG